MPPVSVSPSSSPPPSPASDEKIDPVQHTFSGQKVVAGTLDVQLFGSMTVRLTLKIF